LAPGTGYSTGSSFVVPSVAPGSYYLLLVTDSANQLLETNESNNVFAKLFNVLGPDLVPTGLDVAAGGSAGSSVGFTTHVANQGTGDLPAGGPWRDSLYWSSDQLVDGSDALLFSLNYTFFPALAPGTGYSTGSSFVVPSVAPGSYYLLLVTDSANQLIETNESNNVFAKLFNVLGPDLVPTGLDGATGGSAGSSVGFTTHVANQGTGDLPAGGPWRDSLYWSSDQLVDGSDALLFSLDYTFFPALAPGTGYSTGSSFVVPSVAPGSYYLLLVTDSANQLVETNESNNVFAKLFNVLAPDLVPTGLDVATGSSAGSSVGFTTHVANQGTGDLPAGGPWRDSLYWSSDQLVDGSDALLFSLDYTFFPALAPGTGYSTGSSFVVPSVAPGSYYLLLVTDSANQLVETNESNNVFAKLFNVLGAPPHAVITTPAPPIYVNEDITLSGASSYHDDPNRSIVTYEWDFAYNAALGFHVQATGQVVTKIGGYPAPGTYTVALRVTDDNPPAQGGPQSSIATAEITVVVVPQADLELVKSVSPVSLLLGSVVAYTFAITNHGPQAAANVSFSDDLDNSLVFQSFGAGTAACVVTVAPALLSCLFGTVAAGVTVQRTINFTATAAGDFSNTATVSSSTADPDTTNNTSTASLHVASPVAGTPDLIAADDTGISDTDNKTRITQPRFDVAAQAGLLVELLVDGVLVGASAADSSGQARIQVDLAHALSDGIHLVTARARVSVSSAAGPESAALSVLVDTAAPTGTFNINGDAPIIGGTVATDDPNLLLQLTFADSVGGSGLSRMAVSSDGGGTFEPDEDYGAIAAVTLPGPDGLFTVAVRVTDVAGNVVTVLKQVRLDTTGPVIATSGVAGGTAYDIGVTLHLTYGATDAGVGLAMIGATLDTTTALASGTAIATSGLTAGAHTIVVTATDLLGNQSVVTITFEVSASALGLCAGVRDGVARHLIDPNMENPLCAKARAAQAAINRGDYSGARGVLGAFIHQVAAQRGKKIDSGYAGLLTGWANDLISRLP